MCVLGSQSFMQFATHAVPWARICAGVSGAPSFGAVLAIGPVGKSASLLDIASDSAWATPQVKTSDSEQT